MNQGKTIYRNDITAAFNRSEFRLVHFASGFFPVGIPQWHTYPVNRLFHILNNPRGADNFIEEAGMRHVLRPGCLYFIPAGLQTRWKLDESLEFLSIHTSLEYIPGVDLFSGCSKMLVLRNPPEIPGLMRILRSEDDDVFFLSIEAGRLAFDLQTSLMKLCGPGDFREVLALKRYAVLTDYLAEHGNAQTSVGDLAEIAGESREVFARKFTAATGITPKKLIDRFIIRRCLDDMNAGLGFKEISARLNFSSEFAFSRFFKRLLGESPRKWRESSRKQI